MSKFRETLNYRPTLDLWGCSGFGNPADAVRTWTSTTSGSIVVTFDVKRLSTNGIHIYISA